VQSRWSVNDRSELACGRGYAKKASSSKGFVSVLEGVDKRGVGVGKATSYMAKVIYTRRCHVNVIRKDGARNLPVCCPPPTKAQSYIFAFERHDVFQIRHISKESPYYIASRWILTCSSRVLCISIAMRITKFCTRGGGRRGGPCVCFILRHLSVGLNQCL
jgi:hypothetical protein